MDEKAISSVQELLSQPRKIVLTTHKSPDGDAIGSSMAMQRFLKAAGHEVYAVVPDAFPDFLSWMEGAEEMLVFDEQPKEVQEHLDSCDVIFSLDYNAFHRTGPDLGPRIEANTSATRVLIDHHQQPSPDFDIAFSDTTACSTAQMVYEFVEALGQTELLDGAAAEALYTGIMTDTGSFRFPATTADTHRIVAKLIDLGANNAAVHQRVFDNNTYQRQKLLGYAMGQKLRYLPEYNAAVLSLSKQELEDHGYQKGDTEGFVNMALSIKGVRLAVFVSEKEAGVRLSLRSKGDFSVNQMARDHFNGGGHINAAGGASDLSIEETVQKFIDLLPHYQKELTA